MGWSAGAVTGAGAWTGKGAGVGAGAGAGADAGAVMGLTIAGCTGVEIVDTTRGTGVGAEAVVVVDVPPIIAFKVARAAELSIY